MSQQNFFGSKKLFIFNIILFAMIVGFGLGIGFLGLNGAWSPKNQAFAEEKPVVVPASLYDMQNTFRAISKNLLPSVVEIRTEQEASSGDQEMPFQPLVPPFDFFFGPQAPNKKDGTKPDEKKQPRSQGLGSGVIIQRQDDKVYILTNNHVTDKTVKITVKLYDGREYPGTLVGADQRRDLALVSIQTKEQDLALAKLGNSDDLQVGDWVLAIGNPLGLDFTVTSGIVSALGRRGGPDDSVNINSYIQTDASINRGNSGGALVNLKGELIGINTWIASPNGASVGLGFAIPINSAKKPIQDFISRGAVRYGWLGASVSDITKEMATDLGVGTTKGAFIPHVFRGSPAEKAGILPGDFITAINGHKVSDMNDMVQTVGDLPAGENADFEVLRQGQKLNKTVKIEPRAKESELKNMKLWPGIVVAPITDDVREQIDIPKNLQGVIVGRVEERSTADIAGLKTGDVLTAVNGNKVKTISDFYKNLNANSAEIKLTFQREGVELSIGISR